MTTTVEPTVLVGRSGGVITMTLNRPKVRNAMSVAMIRELALAIDAAEADPLTRLIVLRGAGGHFSSGGDIAEMAAANAAPSDVDDPIRTMSVSYGQLATRFARTGLAVVAVVEGAAMGGGFGLACAADVTIASPTARFGLPEAKRGIIPAQILPSLLERIGYAHTKRLAVTAGTIDAEQAREMGLVHQVTADVEMALSATVDEIMACAPEAVAATKRLLFDMRLAENGALIGQAADVFVDAVRGAEGREGTRSFLDKRRPSWVT